MHIWYYFKVCIRSYVQDHFEESFQLFKKYQMKIHEDKGNTSIEKLRERSEEFSQIKLFKLDV